MSSAASLSGAQIFPKCLIKVRSSSRTKKRVVKNGHIRRVVDDEVKSLVLELSGTNVATTYITCPIKARASLGIKLPFLVMVVKNMKKYFTFEIQIADDKDMRRRFRVSNFQSTTKVRPFCTTMPIGLSPGWNQIQFNLADFTRRAYGSTYLETVRMQIHANVRIRRIYFSDRLYADDEMPHEFKLFLPIPGTQRRQPSVQSKKKPSKTEVVEVEIASAAPPGTPVELAEPAPPEAPAPPPPPEEKPPEAAPEETQEEIERGKPGSTAEIPPEQPIETPAPETEEEPSEQPPSEGPSAAAAEEAPSEQPEAAEEEAPPPPAEESAEA